MAQIKKDSAKAVVLRINNGGLEILTFKYLEAPNPQKALNKMALPGGKLDDGESYAQALEREVKEETGIVPKIIGRKIGDFNFMYRRGDDEIEINCEVYPAIVGNGELRKGNLEESTSTLSEPFWIAIDEIELGSFIADEFQFVEAIKNETDFYMELVQRSDETNDEFRSIN